MPSDLVRNSRASTLWSDHSRWGTSNVIETVELLDTKQVLRHQDNRWRHVDQVPRRDIGIEDYPAKAHLTMWGNEFARTQPHRFWLFDFGRQAVAGYDTGGNTLSQTSVPEFNGSSNLSIHGGSVTGVVNNLPPLGGEWVANFHNKSARLYDNTLITTHSFLMGGWFRLRSLARTEDIFFYGSTQTGAKHIGLRVQNDNQLELHYNTGSSGETTLYIDVPSSIRIRDLKWHYIGLLWDRPRSKVSVIITDGAFHIRTMHTIDAPAISDFSNADAHFSIGSQGTRIQSADTLQADVCNVKIYRWGATDEVDYAVIPLEIAGIRDNPAKGITIDHQQDNAKRGQSRFELQGAAGAYTYALMNLDEGHYTLRFYNDLGPDRGAYQIFIDNENHGYIDTYHTSAYADWWGMIDDIELTRGFHFVKLFIHGKNSASTGTNIDMAKLVMFKTDGTDEATGSSLTLYGEELTEKPSKIYNQFRSGLPYHNSLTQASSPQNGDSAAGVFHLSSGAYNMQVVLGTANNAGILDIILNGRTVMTVDCLATTTNPQLIIEDRYVRLEQGRNRLEVKVNGKNATSTGHYMHFCMARFNKVAGSAKEPHTTVNAFDQDITSHSASTIAQTVNNNARHAIRCQSNGAAAHFSVRRDFGGGLYIAELFHTAGANGGTLRVRVGGDDVFTGISQSHTSEEARSVKRLVEIPHGYHEVEFENTGTSGNINFSEVVFTPIARMPLADDAVDDPDQDGLVVLAARELVADTHYVNFDLAPILPHDYDETVMTVFGETEGNPASLAMVFNNEYGNVYRTAGVRKVQGATLADWGLQGGWLELVNGASLGADRLFNIRCDMRFVPAPDGTGYRLIGGGRSHTNRASMEHFEASVESDWNNVNRMAFFAVGLKQFKAGTKFRIYGRKNKS